MTARLLACWAMILVLSSISCCLIVHGEELKLFETSPSAVSAEIPLFETAPTVDLFADNQAPSPTRSATTEPAEVQPWAYCYSANWCNVCRTQKRLVNPAYVKYITGDTGKPTGKHDHDATLLPTDVQAYAEDGHGYPVWKIKTHSGDWIWAWKARSPADLQSLRSIKSGDKLPESTFAEFARQKLADEARIAHSPPK